VNLVWRYVRIVTATAALNPSFVTPSGGTACQDQETSYREPLPGGRPRVDCALFSTRVSTG
jgi:hypothetical protein